MTKQSRPKYLVTLDAVIKVCSSNLYNGYWIQDNVLVHLISLHNDLKMDIFQLRRSFGHASLQMLRLYKTPNDLGIYNQVKRGKNCRNYYFYFTKQANCIPPSNKMKKLITSLDQFQVRRSPRTPLPFLINNKILMMKVKKVVEYMHKIQNKVIAKEGK